MKAHRDGRAVDGRPHVVIIGGGFGGMAAAKALRKAPVRITLTLPALNTAEETWLFAAGPEKSAAVGMVLAGAGPVQLPAAAVRGVERTLWLLDRAAAGEVPPSLRSLR